MRHTRKEKKENIQESKLVQLNLSKHHGIKQDMIISRSKVNRKQVNHLYLYKFMMRENRQRFKTWKCNKIQKSKTIKIINGLIKINLC